MYGTLKGIPELLPFMDAPIKLSHFLKFDSFAFTFLGRRDAVSDCCWSGGGLAGVGFAASSALVARIFVFIAALRLQLSSISSSPTSSFASRSSLSSKLLKSAERFQLLFERGPQLHSYVYSIRPEVIYAAFHLRLNLGHVNSVVRSCSLLLFQLFGHSSFIRLEGPRVA